MQKTADLLLPERKKKDLRRQHQRDSNREFLFSCLVMKQVHAQQGPTEPPAAASPSKVETRILHFPRTALRLSIP